QAVELDALAFQALDDLPEAPASLGRERPGLVAHARSAVDGHGVADEDEAHQRSASTWWRACRQRVSERARAASSSRVKRARSRADRAAAGLSARRSSARHPSA